MVEQETYNPYTLADIERYLQGKMTAAEMHAMEKAALQDPFLSDAIEGYSRAPISTAHDHLNEIAAALSASREEAKVIAMPVKKRWWAAWGAAAAAVVAGIIAITFIATPSTKRPADMAAKQTNTPVFTDTTKSEGQQPAAPSAGFIADLGKKDNAADKKTNATSFKVRENQVQREEDKLVELKKEPIIDSEDKPVFLPDTPRAPTLVASPATAPPPAQATASATYKVYDSSRLYENNKVVDNNALGNASVVNIGNNGNSGPSYLQNNTSNLLLPVNANAAANYRAAKPIHLDSTKNLTDGFVAGLSIVQPDKEMFLQPDGNARAKGRRNSNMQIVLTPIPNFDTVAITYLNNKNKSPNMVVDSNLSPQGGWASFRDFVVKRLDKKADTTDLVEGDVELEFTIDDRGNARDIRITRSLDVEHDAKAADLVKQWPGWITTRKQKKGKVVIQF